MANKFTYLKSGLSFTPLSQPPLNPVSGDVYYDLTLATHRVFTNGKWFNLVRSETDLGPTSASNIIIDLDLGQSQKITIVPDQRYITFKPIDGVIGNTYRVRLVFDDSANFVTPISFHPVMQFVSGSNSQVFATPGGSCVLNITPTASGYTATIESYAGYTFLHNISALPDSMSIGSPTGLYLSENSIYIWGDGSYGQYGDRQTLPTQVGTGRVVPTSPLSSNKSWSRVSAGGSSVIAIEASTGFAWGWGSNSEGMLGTGNKLTTTTPTSVLGGRSWKQLSLGYRFSIGIEASTGFAWSWGSNNSGALGRGILIGTSSPVSVFGGRSFSQVSSGFELVLALEGSTGNAYAWGWNDYGQVGNNTASNTINSPVSVFGGKSFSMVSAGSTVSAAIEGSTGLAWTWGVGLYGQLGTGNSNSSSSPVSVLGGRVFSKITVVQYGANFQETVLALEASTGLAWAWGYSQSLGNSSGISSYSPVSVFGGRSFSDIKGASNGVYAYEASTGLLYTWGQTPGYRRYLDAYSAPVALDPALHGSRSWSQLSLGFDFSAAIEGSTGNVYAWGSHVSGGLGQSIPASSIVYSPISVFGGRSYSQIVVAGYSTSTYALAIEGATGNAYGWGYNGGVLGNSSVTNTSSPVSVFGGRSWKQVAGGGASGNCAVGLEGSTGNAYTWGYNLFGSLGNSIAISSTSSPVSVVGGRSWKQVAVGDGSFMCAIEGSTGNAYAWGYGGNGNLGNNNNVNSSSPVSVLGGRSFKQLAVTISGAVAAIEASSGYIWTWGQGTNNEQGNGLTFSLSPATVSTLKSFSQVYATNQNFFATEGSTGFLYSWGSNSQGQLATASGIGASPEQVLSNKSFKQFPAGGAAAANGIAMDPYNTIYFWGKASGQLLGLGYAELGTGAVNSPVSVARFYTKF